MYNRFVLIVIFVPLAIILIALAVANRAPVAFTIDPFNPGNPALTLQLPLFVLPVRRAGHRHWSSAASPPGSSRAATASWRDSARQEAQACATRRRSRAAQPVRADRPLPQPRPRLAGPRPDAFRFRRADDRRAR